MPRIFTDPFLTGSPACSSIARAIFLRPMDRAGLVFSSGPTRSHPESAEVLYDRTRGVVTRDVREGAARWVPGAARTDAKSARVGWGSHAWPIA